MNKLKGLYLITDDKLTPQTNILYQVEQALKGGARIIQLRDKKSTNDDLENMAYLLKKLIIKYNALYIINDRVLLAKKVNADGVHIGDEDENIKKAREILKDKIIGVSCYGNINQALEAEKNGADYVAFGSVFPSSTKKDAKVIGVDIFKKAREKIKIPICAIGGINSSNISNIEYDIDMKAVISDIWGDNVKEKAKLLSSFC
jgi:thiamine-phosphate pyrophosphorylase